MQTEVSSIMVIIKLNDLLCNALQVGYVHFINCFYCASSLTSNAATLSVSSYIRLGLIYLSLPAAFALTEMVLRVPLFGWLCCWLIGWLVGWLAGWLVGWFFGCLVGWLAGWLVIWLVGWLVGWLIGWLVDCCSPVCFLFNKCLLASFSWFALRRYFAVHIKGRTVRLFSEGLRMLVN